MASLTARVIMNVLYRSPFNPKSADLPDDTVVDLVEGDHALPPGRALDLGCGRGRHTLYLAKHGWDATGIDLVGHAVRMAKQKAQRLGLNPTLIRGDCTELAKLGVKTGQNLLVDAGCFHGLPVKYRDAYVPAVTRIAAPGAVFVMLGHAKHPVLKGVNADELRRRFLEWDLEVAEKVTPEDMLRYGGDMSKTVEKAFENDSFEPWRYQLRRKNTIAARP